MFCSVVSAVGFLLGHFSRGSFPRIGARFVMCPRVYVGPSWLLLVFVLFFIFMNVPGSLGVSPVVRPTDFPGIGLLRGSLFLFL